LCERIGQEDRDVASERTSECDSVVRSYTHEARDFKLSEREANESEETVESDRSPETTNATPCT
jgi:hypothetical protein